ncbi:class D beta-lactamase [Massilia horti]|uniref:Beta-lactamase n=1 Tax=Massilia horti TaxID=2562153 RepID=A0A4Y9T4J8_9BURK|nr:class D beta-lactamase [Massilia horti]TFW33200.1 class D beta-lactamase [Massilia horti]
MNLRQFAMVALAATLAISNASAREVCTAIADASTGKILLQRGECEQRVTPASTFKIAISLMGYDSGFLKDGHTPALPFREGYVDWIESWKQPTDPARWMKESVVWYSQQITQSLGKERFAQYTKNFQFGNADVSGDAKHDGLTLSWINSSLRISPLEQLSFLTKLVNRQLGVSQHAYDMTAELTKNGQLPGEWKLHGKTGWASDWGWYVGWASKGTRSFVFARLIKKDDADPKDVAPGVVARDGLIGELPALLGSQLK